MAAVEQLITDNLAIWSSAIQTKSSAGRGKSNKLELYGIKNLRALILELAVRGLLVPQEPNDKPASELLKKIAAKKARLLKDGKIKKQKPPPPIQNDEAPFRLPEGWAWSRLTEICQIITQGPNPKYDGIEDDNYRVIKTKDFYDHIIHYHNADRISGDVFSANAKHRLQTGDVIFGLVGKGSTGKCNIFVEQEECSYIYTRATGLVRLVDADLVSPRYIKTVFISGYGKGKTSDLEDGSTGQIVIKTSLLKELEFPVPPLAEQRRIVAKVDELMALCDELEQQQETSIAAHQTLVLTLLDALTTASECDGFTAAWARIADHFNTLFTTEWSIDQLKQTILQLAVMGKLVPQDLNDEPASELVKKIAAEKAKLVKDKKIKKPKALPPITEDKQSFTAPEGWEWVRLQDISEYIQRGKGPKYSDVGAVRVVSQKCIQWGGFNIEIARHVDDSSLDKYQEERYLKDNDLLWNSTGTGTVGRINLINDVGAKALVADSHVTVIRTLLEDSGFICSYISSTGIQARMEPSHENPLVSGTTNQVELNTSSVVNLPIPVPPLTEQARIIAKVDELMALCDMLKTSISSAQATQLQLAGAMADQAFSKGNFSCG